MEEEIMEGINVPKETGPHFSYAEEGAGFKS